MEGITLVKFHSIFLNKIDPFENWNGRMCKALFANDDKIIKRNYSRKKLKKLIIKIHFLLNKMLKI